MQLTNLWSHVYEVARLREAYYGLNPKSAPEVDGMWWYEYGKELERNLEELSDRLRSGRYRAKPVKRQYIPKADGRQRPIGIPALEDKIVQRAATEVLNAVYESEFKGFSYGFRPGRSQHRALDALYIGLMRKRVGWVLDADIQGFFDTSYEELLPRNHAPMAFSATASQPEGEGGLETNVQDSQSMATRTPHYPSLSRASLWGHYLRQEPGAVIPPAGICAGAAGRPAVLPRPGLVSGLILGVGYIMIAFTGQNKGCATNWRKPTWSRHRRSVDGMNCMVQKLSYDSGNE